MRKFIEKLIAFIIVAVILLIALGSMLLILGLIWNGVLTVWNLIL